MRILKFLILTLLFSKIDYVAAQNAEKKPVLIQPQIIVIPFTKENEDIRTILESDINRRVGVTKVKEAFDNHNFNTVDFTAKLKSAMDDKLFSSTNQSDIKSQLMEMSGADIYVEVEVPEMIASNGGNSARIILTAYDVSTGNSLSNKVCESPKFFTNDYGALVTRALTSGVDDFINTIENRFSDMRFYGRSVKINFNLLQTSKLKFSTEIKPNDLPLSDVLETWMADNSYKNSYHIQGTTDTKMIFDDVKIPIRDESGHNYNPNKFALKIFQFLKSTGLNCTKEIKNGTIFINLK